MIVYIHLIGVVIFILLSYPAWLVRLRKPPQNILPGIWESDEAREARMKANLELLGYFSLLFIWCGFTQEYARVMNILITSKQMDMEEKAPWQCEQEGHTEQLSIANKLLLLSSKTFNAGACIEWRHRVLAAHNRNVYPNVMYVVFNGIGNLFGLNLYSCFILILFVLFLWTFFPYLYFIRSRVPSNYQQAENQIISKLETKRD